MSAEGADIGHPNGHTKEYVSLFIWTDSGHLQRI
jgi:hypothetical protein